MKKAVTSFKQKVVGGLILLGSVPAFAEIDLSGVSYNTDDVMKVAALVLAAVAVIWGVRKAISVANRG